MSVSDDIGNLFQRFGGDADRYQEVARDDDAKHAASRWPLLTALDIAQPEQVPGAGRPAVHVVAAEESTTHDPATSALPHAPLFARNHRHATMPPPADPVRHAATRFSPPPQAKPAASETEGEPHVAAAGVTAAAAAPSNPPPAVAMPNARATGDAMRDASRQSSVGIFSNRKQTFAQSPVTGVDSVRLSQQSARPFTPQPTPQPVPQSAQQPAPAPRSILSDLFATPVHEPPPTQPASRDLGSVFARLANTPGLGRAKPGGEPS